MRAAAHPSRMQMKPGPGSNGPSRAVVILLAALGAVMLIGLVVMGGGPRDLRAWPPGLVHVHLAAGIALAAVLLALPPLVGVLMRRAGRALDWRFALFAACLAVLGLAQLVHLATFWLPMFWLEAALKLAGVALALAVLAVVATTLPVLLARPSQQQWRDATETLRAEVDARRAAEVTHARGARVPRGALQRAHRRAGDGQRHAGAPGRMAAGHPVDDHRWRDRHRPRTGAWCS